MSRGRSDANRGQSNVVGVAVLLGIAVVSLGALTAAVGVVVDSTAAEADAERVASDFETALEPVAATGPQRARVTFSEGTIRSVDRVLEVRVDGAVREHVAVDALVFESGDRRVTFLAGAIVRGSGTGAWMETPPQITVGDDVFIVGAPRLGDGIDSLSGRGGVTAVVETDVSHDRHELGDGTFTIAIETATPGPWERYFYRLGEPVEDVRVDPGAGDLSSVVARFDGDRTGYLVVHDLDAEVSARG